MSHYAFAEFLNSARKYSQRPALFEPGNAPFWDNPYISTQLLKFHLDPSVEAASRSPDRIDAQAENLVSSGVLKHGDRLLDLGCGPGLYSLRLAKKGLKVTGVDISTHSLNYAIEEARKSALAIDYRQMDFLHLDYESEFDAVLQSYGEINTFSDHALAELLSHIHTALKPHGLLLFDLTTRTLRKKSAVSNRWYVTEGGLWKPGLHFVLEEGFDYPDRDVFCNQYIVSDDDGLSVYRFWFHDYNLVTIKEVLEKNGFVVEIIWNDFDGTPFSEGSDFLAIVARKV